MLNKKLAELIFPKAKPIFYYEDKYKQRELPSGAMVTRFAPSPTGYVHIGGIYQVIINRKLAEQTNGIFILRIEDTDQKRQIKDGTIQIVESLKDFGLEFDEAMLNEIDEKGNYGPYKQSLRKEIYEAYAKHLIEQGRAYPCFCTEDQLSGLRKTQETLKIMPGYYGNYAHCRNISVEEAIDKIEKGEKYVIRFRSNGSLTKKIKYRDLIKGDIEFPENIQDIVIIKSDGLPTYHFAHAVDDHLMRVTHVIRSDEWLSSVPLHLELFDTLGFTRPEYLHTAPILKEEDGKKRKISKRKDPEAAVSFYYQEGIPTQALHEYLLNIINSNFEDWRKQNPQAPISEFSLDIKRMNTSGALFDMAKLLDISKTVISKYSAEQVYEKSLNWAEKYDEKLKILLSEKEFALKIFNIERGGSRPRRDIGKWSDVKESIIYMYDSEFFARDRKYEYQKVDDKEIVNKILELYGSKYYDENDDKETWFNKIKDLAEEIGFAREVKDWKKNPDKWPGHVGDVSMVIRVALTARTNTPDMYELMKILGKEKVLKRLNAAREVY